MTRASLKWILKWALFSRCFAQALAGGITNCPNCGRATQVAGLRDPLWRLLQIGGAVLLLVVGALVLHFQGPLAASLTVVIGAAVLWLVSRGF